MRPALHGQSADVFVRVMNRINVVILNPVFLVVFLSAPALAAALLWWHRNPVAVGALVAAAVALLITVIFNVPLNDALAASGDREAFENPWLVWHVVRTVSATTALVLLCLPGATR